MMRAGFAIGLLLASAGCPPQAPGDDSDAATNGVGLVVVVRGEIDHSTVKGRGRSAGVTLTGLTRVELELEDVRAIGDAAPGDDRTTIAHATLEWREQEVQCLAFDNVPPGIYSRIVARVVRYHIEGTIEDGSDGVEFIIDDTPPAPLYLMAEADDVVVDVREDGALALEVSAAHVVDAVDWEARVPEGDGRVQIDGESSDIEMVREAMSEFLRADETGDTSSCPD